MSDNSQFNRLAPFIKDFIYSHKWEEMREIQIEACKVIFDTDDNLLLTSGTASGKTEAAFLPVLTQLYNNPSTSVGVLYISPLKALINDQFGRIEELLLDTYIPVTKWHGDVNQNKKTNLVLNPKGILQTTPESLEAMVMRKPQTVIKLFSDLRYIIIDEIHYFMGAKRGTQLLSIMERIQRLTGVSPRRIGLSATLSDTSGAEEWLNAGTTRKCTVPSAKSDGHKIRLALSLVSCDVNNNANVQNSLDNYMDVLFKATKDKRSIMFANSKEEVEYNMAQLKSYVERKHLPDIYDVHHGSISKDIREDVERRMKSSVESICVGSTATLELGIDIGSLDRIVQTGNPFYVSRFVQRLGRSGRRGNPSEMIFAMYEEYGNQQEFYKEINWDLIMTLAIIQLYLEEKWIEPVYNPKLPFGVCYHQTLSVLASSGQIGIAKLAETILTLTPFKNIPKSDYKQLLQYLIDRQVVEIDGDTIMLARQGERETNSYMFYAVFEVHDAVSVRCESEVIGTLDVMFPIGYIFALAGRTWEVIDVDNEGRNLYVKRIKGVSTIAWQMKVDFYIHTRILHKMRSILQSDSNFSYIDQNAKARLDEMRGIARNSGMLTRRVVRISSSVLGVFTWLGTKAISALSYSLAQEGFKNEVELIGGVPVCLLVHTTESEELLEQILCKLKHKPIDKHTFEVGKIAFPGKFTDVVPEELQRREYIEDCVDVEDMQNNL